jgi:hypothetical protein
VDRKTPLLKLARIPTPRFRECLERPYMSRSVNESHEPFKGFATSHYLDLRSSNRMACCFSLTERRGISANDLYTHGRAD